MHPMQNRVLVIDDSRAQRRLLATLLCSWGHDVVEFDTAEDAMTTALDPSTGLVICDWMMPGMTGPEFCRRLRSEQQGGYAYVLLLTSNSESGALAEGLEAGADDFLSKPVHPPELRARLNAGARILAMQGEVVNKNTLLTSALDEIRSLYAALDRDLDEARRLQEAQMQEPFRRFETVDVSLWLKAAGHIGGDMVGCFPVNPDTIGVFGLDVSGHGVASAMIAARVAGILSAASPDQNIALSRHPDGSLSALSPEVAATRLNQMILRELRSDRYFTLALGFLNRRTGRVRMVQAGHPYPIVLRKNGEVDQVGDGGLPIGLVEDAGYSSFDIQLTPGDRLLIYSDGLPECPDPSGNLLEEDGLALLMRDCRDLRGPDFLNGLHRSLTRFSGGGDFPDDVSALMVEFEMP